MEKTNCKDGYVAYNFTPPIKWIPEEEFVLINNSYDGCWEHKGAYYTLGENGKLHRVIIIKGS